MSHSYIYVIAAAPEGPVKIGISHDPDRRVRQLQTGHPGKLSVYHREPVTAVTVRPLERLLHRDISHLCRRGEWFDLCVSDATLHVQYTIIRYGAELGLDDIAVSDEQTAPCP